MKLTTMTDKKMATAATMKAEGARWEDVAKALGLSPDTVAHWPVNYRAEWNAHLVAALDRTLATVQVEAMVAARRALRSTNEGIALRAATELLAHCRKLQGERQILEHTGPGGAPLQLQGEILAAVREYEVVLMRNEPAAEADGPAAVEVEPGNE